MITIIRNDCQARFAHDVYGLKIKEEKPLYKIIGTLNNEGICLYESPNYGEIAITFDIIIDAIMSGAKSVMIHPPKATEKLTKEEYDESDIQDFCTYGNAEKREMPPLGTDMYGRPLNPPPEDCKPCHHDDIPENWQISPDKDCQDYYSSQYKSEFDGYRSHKTFNNKYYDNNYPNPTRNFGEGEPL